MTAAVLQRHQSPLVYLLVAAASLPAGVAVARSQQGISMALLALLGLCGVILLVNVPPHHLFLGWLFLAPVFQAASEQVALGRALGWALYTAPALLFIALTIARRDSRGSSWVDVLPGAFAAYVFASILITTDTVQTNPSGTLRYFYMLTALGPAVYYFLTIGPGRAVRPQAIMATVMAAGIVQGALAMVDLATGWNPWGYYDWQEFGGPVARATATLANPGLLGVFLGVAIVCATAFFSHGGPRNLRWLAGVTLLVCIPGAFASLTRGPILATAVAATLLLLHGRLRLLGVALIGATALAVIAVLPSVRASEIYEERVVERTNVLFRENLQDWSLRLAAEKPILGWGHGSFDQVKNAAGFNAEGISISGVLEHTSHNTFLTMLVELGGLGVLLYALPFAILGWRGLARARLPDPDRWMVTAALAALIVILLSGSTFDLRFFSIGVMLPWLLLAILRRVTDTPRTGTSSVVATPSPRS